jgi:hypothetical protein
MWPWLKDVYLKNGTLLDELDERYVHHQSPLSIDSFYRYKSIPAAPKIHHFPSGVTKLKYITAKEHNIVLRVSFHSLRT